MQIGWRLMEAFHALDGEWRRASAIASQVWNDASHSKVTAVRVNALAVDELVVLLGLCSAVVRILEPDHGLHRRAREVMASARAGLEIAQANKRTD